MQPVYVTADGNEIEKPSSIIADGYEIHAPDDATLARVGIFRRVDDPTPDGMVQTGWADGVTIRDGIAHRAPRYMPAAEYQAQNLAAMREAAAKQAQSDATDYRAELLAVAALAQLVPSIVPGDGMPKIAAKARAAYNAQMAAGEFGAASHVTAASLTALTCWSEVLKPAGVAGDRLWRALGIIAAGGGQ